MKKTTILFTLLLCFIFSNISAQCVLRWSVNTPDGGATLKIKIDGVVVVDVQQAQYAPTQSGIISLNNYSTLEYEATSSGAPLLCAASETLLVPGYIASCYDENGNFRDPYIYSESWSWTVYDDDDYTIQLTTIPNNS